MKELHVVAAILRDGERVFATQRGYGDWKDFWEFPGGKIEAGETPEEALIREIREELGAQIAIDGFLTTGEWDYPDFHLRMRCYLAHVTGGELTLKEHEDARWLSVEELDSVDWLPADRAILPLLRSGNCPGGNTCKALEDRMQLIEPTAEFAQQIRAYRQEFLDRGDSMDGTGALKRTEDPREWIEQAGKGKDPRTVRQGLVPATQYLFVREEDRKIVGMLQIRHCFNDYLEKFGGHIGYSVAPSERRKGYAARMLRLALPRCRELGLKKVLITCERGNEGSRRTILKNGGVFESAVYEPDEGVTLERYWIDLSEQNTENQIR